jgi:hypothetical protein
MANQVASALLRSARSYAGQLSSLIKSLAPSHLKDNVQTHAEEVREGTIRIHVEVTGKDAHAQEYGSGLHTDGRKGVKAKYPIRPRDGGMLAFRENAKRTWDYSRGNPPPIPKAHLQDGRGLFFGVMHPGIKKYKGRGYINPAIREFRTKAMQKGSGMREEIRQAILGEIRKSFTNAGRK